MATFLKDPQYVRLEDDPNDYRIGHIDSADQKRQHRVVLTTMPRDDTRNAAATCTDMLRTFPGIRCVVLAGVAGGVPSLRRPDRHVRLGDVVVAVDGIVDYGHVRLRDGIAEPRRPVTGVSMDLVRAVRRLQVESYDDNSGRWISWLTPARDQPMATFRRPPPETDLLVFRGRAVPHPPPAQTGHVEGLPKIHYGKIGCADVLMLDEERRDNLAARHDLLAFEMEAAGVAASAASHGIGWFTVRGIVDYCDRAKNDVWHPYASLTAAAYVRAMLGRCQPFPVWRMAPGRGAIALLPDHELDSLVALLEHVHDLDLQAVWRAATGELTPLPPSPPTGAVDLFNYLAGLNAGLDQVPPALAFVEEVAGRVDRRLGARLRQWVDHMAARLHLVEVMHEHRARVEERRLRNDEPNGAGQQIKPCLVIQVEGDGIDRERCEVRYWIQRSSDRWQPEPGEPRQTAFKEVEEAMQAAVRHAESAWRDNDGPVGIELLLPTDLLHKAVEWWHTELEAPAPTPLCLDYPVVVRSLDRMRATYRHRVWINRWKTIWRHPPGHRLYWGRMHTQENSIESWNARLRDNAELTTVVLSSSPEHTTGREELQSALNAGVAVILWDRRAPLQPDTASLIEEATQGHPNELPHRIRVLRTAAATAAHEEQARHPGRHIALLWDDPNRTVEAGGH
ncbi:hypothetical protein Val02_53710 [Virgisporangium aliadipatigenens]|uniref:Nucleoside phosphorylase domain-containing protein n=2 Tax=Virgisporangium aliadipatigenens TaxID=741659 RepID=A0A8J3YRA4_9ACTN|nr:hypothetical protein Val02_53710 [Virgisporangium aliadipatigenens]